MKRLIIAIFVIAIFVINLTVTAHSITLEGETIGYVINRDGDYIHIVGDLLSEVGFEDVIIDVNGSFIYDLLTGFPISSQDIHIGTSIRAIYRISQEEPFDALTVWLNWDSPDSAVFSAEVSLNIQYGNNSCAFLSADGKYLVMLSEDTIVVCPFRGEISPLDITFGQELFIWVDMITASTPAIVYPDMVVLME